MALRRTRSRLRLPDEIQNPDGSIRKIASIDEILNSPPASEIPRLPQVPIESSDNLER